MTRLEVKRRLARVAGASPRSHRRDVILLYHSVGNGPWAVAPADFRAQMEWASAAARMVGLAALNDGGSGAGLRVAVTFDDGYESLFREVRPIARALGLRPALFLNTGLVGCGCRAASQPRHGHYPGEQFMLWDEVERLAAEGWTVGSHGVTHLDFTRADDDVVRAQLHESKAAIERNLAIDCTCFAYTWGRHSRHLRALVAEAGYAHAYTGMHGPVGWRGDPLAIPRINISQDYSLADFKAILRGDWDYLGWWQRAKALAG